MKAKKKPDQTVRQQVLADHREIGLLLQKLADFGDSRQAMSHLRQLQPLLQRHFDAEESEFDGMHAGIRARTPEQQNVLLELKAEHKELLACVHDLLAPASPARKPSVLRERCDRLREQLGAHEAKESAVFMDSVWTDVGEGD